MSSKRKKPRLVNLEKANAEIEVQKENVTLANKIHTYRQMIFAIYDSPEFSVEFGYMVARTTGLKVLIVDADALEPSVAQHMGLKKYVNSNVSSPLMTDSSFNMAMDYVAKHQYNKEMFLNMCINASEGLYVLTGNDDHNNYEYYPENSFKKLIDISLNIFDIVIINTCRNIYDEFLVNAFFYSTINIVPIDANVCRFNSINRHLAYLEDKQAIDINKTVFVAFNYNSKIHLDKTSIKEVTDNNFIGAISYTDERIKARNKIYKCYAKSMPLKMQKEYVSIMIKLNLFPKKELKKSFKSLFS